MKTLAPSTLAARTGAKEARGTRRPMTSGSKSELSSRRETALPFVMFIGVTATSETERVVGTGPTNEKTERKIEVKKSNGASHRTMNIEALEIMILEGATASVQKREGERKGRKREVVRKGWV